MNDKTANQQPQQQQQQAHNPWAMPNNPAWQPFAGMQFYGNQGGVPYGQHAAAYGNQGFYPGYYTEQQRIAFNNANNALMQNGIRNQFSGMMNQSQNNQSQNNRLLNNQSQNNHSLNNQSQNNQPMNNLPLNNQPMKGDQKNVLPPLPPGPPPPLKPSPFQSTMQQVLPNSNNMLNASAFYGQPQNTAFPPITFNLNNKKTGLGYVNNSGAGKKKRRRNNKQQQQQQPGCPPLPSDPPPFPPLPPPPPPPPAPVSPLVTPPKNNWGGLNTSEAWPDSLKAYVNRCYAKCVEDVDKDQVEIILKGKITSAANDGSLWIRNWDMELLPSLYSERKTIEIKKPDPPKTPMPPTAMRGAGVRQGRGLSAQMGSRLGGFGRPGQPRRSRSRSPSPGVKGRRLRSRSRSRDVSRSPVRRRKDRRSSSASSSSSDENFKPLVSVGKKKRGGSLSGRLADRLDGNKATQLGAINKRNKKMLKQEKAKSHFYSEFGKVGQVPVNAERLEKRAARFEGMMKGSPSPTVVTKARRRPFSLGVPSSVFTIDNMSDVDWQNFHIVGTCKDVDKQYLRQTTAPDASTIRPVDVLQKSLVAVQERWKKDSDYFFACDRLKSIRLDLTLQGIRTDFTVKVYETHARIALEKGDHQELNQCLSQLTQLYAEVGGAHRLEFTAYGILYYVFTKDTLELSTLLARLSEQDKMDASVVHAVGVKTAWITSNYHRFFKLYRAAPKMAGYAVDLFLQRERITALKVIIKAYRPSIPVSYVSAELEFESEAGCLEFLAPFGLAYTDSNMTKIDCKLSTPIITKC